MDKEYKSRERREDGYGKTNREHSSDRGSRSESGNRPRLEKPRSERPGGERNFNRESGEKPRFSREGGYNRDNRGSGSRDAGGGNRYGGDSRGNGEKRLSRPGEGYQNRGSSGDSRGGRDFNRERPAYNRDNRGNGEQGRFSREGGYNRERKPGGGDFNRDTRGSGYHREERSGGYNRDNRESGERKYSSAGREGGYNRDSRGTDRNYNSDRRSESRSYDRSSGEQKSGLRLHKREDRVGEPEKEELRSKHYSKVKQLAHRLKNEGDNIDLRLNRYISMGGICSRRDADELIKAGRVKVNGEIVQSVGTKVNKKDQVEVDDAVIIPERKVYLVLNKPKDFVTTVEDPLERKTVMSLVEHACKERIYPVGRLDRQTTGVLLFTNDGDLAKKLTHPKYDHKKIYHVFLDKTLIDKDMEAILKGFELVDGFVQADDISYVSEDKTEVGIEIHSGKNRIVRRIFEHLGYQIIKLDRVYFAGITKKNVPRGKWRFLTPEEINVLKIY